MRWQDKLTKEERDHVKEFMGRTLEGIKKCRAAQIEMIKERAEGFHCPEPCWTCKQIARKLGID